MNATPFTARLASVMVLAVLAASALTISLDHLKFRRILRNQQDLVYLFVANDVAGAVEDSMNLGIALPMLQTTQQMIERRRDAEPGIDGITVFDDNGTVLFDTERFRIRTTLPAKWRQPPDPAGDWRADLSHSNLVGASLRNSFGKLAGGVVVRYGTADLDARSRSILLEMLRVALACTVAAAVIAVVASALLTRPLRRWFAQASAQLAALPGDDGGSPAEDAEPLIAAAGDALRAMDAAEARLMELGTGVGAGTGDDTGDGGRRHAA